jgi:hypothetical protein
MRVGRETSLRKRSSSGAESPEGLALGAERLIALDSPGEADIAGKEKAPHFCGALSFGFIKSYLDCC